ncbi:MAG: AAA family ATPase [Desulfobacteraceae bacterium]|nr:AAA family ATPase [Desulfobacteraceae bacterium]
MYEQYYGFTRKPFSISPDPSFFFQNAKYNEAYALLQYGMKERRGIFCLFGEVGTGKTMLLQKLMQSLDDSVMAITLPYPNVSFEDILDHILMELKIDVESPKVTVRLAQLQAKLTFENTIGRTIALLVDEAQSMDPSSLESLRLLSNLETPREKLLQIVLLGQPELRDKLNLPSLRQFKQRIAINFELTPLLPEETPQYIAHRLRIAGYGLGLRLFSERAVYLITAYSRGIPRLVNALCDNALLIGCVLKQREIDEKIIREAAADLMLETTRMAVPQPAPAIPAAVAPPAPQPQQDLPGAQPPPQTQPQPQPAFPDLVPELRVTPKPAVAPARSGSTFKWIAYASLGVILLGMVIVKLLMQPDVHESLPGSPALSKTKPEAPARVEKAQRDTGPSSFQNPLVHANSIAPSTAETVSAPVTSSKESVKTVEGTQIPVPPPAQHTAPTAATVAVPTAVAAAAPASPEPVPGKREEVGPLLTAKAETGIMPVVPEPPKAAQPPEPAAVRVATPIVETDPARVASVAPAVIPAVEVKETPRPQPQPEVSSTAEPVSDVRDIAWTVRKGETLLGIAKEVYGSTNLRTLCFIQMANPEIRNIDLIVQGQVLVLPPWSPERMVFPQRDGKYTAFVAATRELSIAREWQNQLNRLGIAELSANAVPVWLSSNNRIYRLQAEGFQSRNSAVACLKTVLPMKFVDSLREEIQ